MDKQFWLDKWQRQALGFHLLEPHSLLSKFYSTIFNPKQGVFIPLCGKSVDLTFFADKGGYTLGNELSEIAVQAFFTENGLVSQRYLLDGMVAYDSENLRLLQGDYFSLKCMHLAGCQTIYDRAALIALPTTMHTEYVAHLKRLLPHAKMLLITLEYEQAHMSGPPFSVEQNEVKALFSFAKVKKLASCDILANEKKFADRGLRELQECAYQIEWSE